jgi:predicted ATPase
MIVGRKTESAQIERLLKTATDGHAGSLVLRGEAGVGKTALLQAAQERARGFRVLSTAGVEFEAELGFAGLHELVGPIIDLADVLPEPQAKGIKAALALEDGPSPDRFAVYAATLGVLAAAASERPLLCLVDDAHWLDRSSAEALVFAARRIDHDPIVMLFAARDPATSAFSAPRLPELWLEG